MSLEFNMRTLSVSVCKRVCTRAQVAIFTYHPPYTTYLSAYITYTPLQIPQVLRKYNMYFIHAGHTPPAGSKG